MKKALAVGRKEFHQIVRDRRTLSILLLAPVIFLLLYGYALNFDIKHVGLAVEDRDQTRESRALVAAFVNSGYFDMVATVHSAREANELMDRNEIRAALVIPENTGRAVSTGAMAPVQILINGDNANTASTVMGYALTIVRSASSSLVLERRGVQAAPLVSAEPRIWYNPELKSALFLVPGLIAFIGMITAAISTALSIVREKERGTWEQVRMAPIGTPSYVVGKTLPYLAISIASAMAIVVAAMALFDLPMRGSWLELLGAVALFLLGALGTGMLISTVSDSQLVAFQIVLVVAFLPTFLLSGFIFPIASMPVPIRMVTTIVPARYFLVALRGIVLKGISLTVVWREVLALAIYAVGVLTLASVRLARERG
ncbi:MAG: ABC transporter permease [Bacteroidales bacterium]